MLSHQFVQSIEGLVRREWAAKWRIEAQRIRPEPGARFAVLTADSEWPEHHLEDPVQSARA